MTSLLQFKPRENSFIKIARAVDIYLKTIILCEGSRDAEVIKVLCKKLGINLRNTGITDCGGIKELTRIARYIIAISRVSYRLKTVGVLIDTDKDQPDKRFRDFKNALLARKIEITQEYKLNNQNFLLQVGNIKLVVHIAGDLSFNFDSHSFDDYLVKLMILENYKINIEQFRTAKQIISHMQMNIYDLIFKAHNKNIFTAFSKTLKFLNTIKENHR